MKKYLIFLLAAAMCLAAAGCGKEKEPDPSALQTPQYSVEEPDIPEPTEEEIHTADQGVKVIEPAAVATADTPGDITPSATVVLTPETVWAEDAVVTWNAFTMPEKAAFDDGSIGVLTISKIGLTVSIYESDDQMEDMDKGAAHFKSTSAWDGNVGLSGHNRTVSGNGAYFRDLHMLYVGDTLTYKTALGEREYRVTAVKTIGDEEWGYLSRTTDNRLSLITCVNDNASKRLLVQAVQK